MYKPNKGQSTRIELRTIDAACNPYLAYAVVLAAGHEGHRGGLRAAARGRGRRLVAHRARAQGLGIEPLPKSLYDAIGSPRTPSCWPRPSASTSSTSSCATSARSGRSTAARSRRSSATGCCRSSEAAARDCPTTARGAPAASRILLWAASVAGFRAARRMRSSGRLRRRTRRVRSSPVLLLGPPALAVRGLGPRDRRQCRRAGRRGAAVADPHRPVLRRHPARVAACRSMMAACSPSGRGRLRRSRMRVHA